jgi:hypothetical protein
MMTWQLKDHREKMYIGSNEGRPNCTACLLLECGGEAAANPTDVLMCENNTERE